MQHGTCYVVGAASFAAQCFRPKPGDLVIAADGGYGHLRALGENADVVVGDFDSLGAVPRHPCVVRHPVMKDDTDAMLAVKVGLQRGYRDFRLLGGLGGRLDHTLANLHTLAYIAACGGEARLMGEGMTIAVLQNGEMTLGPDHTGTVSVFSWGGTARGVYLEGLLYPLRDAVLLPDMPLGVSNAFTGRESKIRVEEGTLMVLWYDYD